MLGERDHRLGESYGSAAARVGIAVAQDPRRLAQIDQAARHGHAAPGEEALIELPIPSADHERGVLAHATGRPRSERRAQRRFVEPIDGTGRGGPREGSNRVRSVVGN